MRPQEALKIKNQNKPPENNLQLPVLKENSFENACFKDRGSYGGT
jgi:hypothetical protein